MNKFSNAEIAKLLRNVSVAYLLKNEKKYLFQRIAYNKAADSIENSPVQLQDIYQEQEKLDKVPGVGASLASYITELFEKGDVVHFKKIKEGIPDSVFVLLDIPNFGPKKAYKIVKRFGLENPSTVINEVKKLAENGQIAELEGFGEKSAADLLQGIEQSRKGATKSNRMNLSFAHAVSEQVISYMKKNTKVQRIETLGSLRRMRDTIGDVDLAAATDSPEEVIEHFIKYPNIERVIEKGPVSASFIATGGAQVDLMVQPLKRFGALLQHFTGSKQHNVALREKAVRQGLSLSERGIKDVKKDRLHEFTNEKDFYNFLSLPYIEPELRENRGEIEAGSRGKLPKLVNLNDIEGDLHVHSNFDVETSHDTGRNSMEEMAMAAKKRGYKYIGFADHNPSTSKHTKKQVIDLVKIRSKKIEQTNKSKKYVRIFNLLEIDILPDGDLALDDDGLALLDGAIISLHSSLSMEKEKMTSRILKALARPNVRIFGHPTARLINGRSGIEADWRKIFELCCKKDIALEVNSSPQRLDLPDILVKEAIEIGCKVIINTDSHSLEGLEMMKYGVSVARRGWCEKHDVVNTFSVDKFEKWLKQ